MLTKNKRQPAPAQAGRPVFEPLSPIDLDELAKIATDYRLADLAKVAGAQYDEPSDDLPDLNGYTVAVRDIDPIEADKLRADTVRFVLREHVRGLKDRLDTARWVNSGWAEVEAFVEILCKRHGSHPALAEWEYCKSRPAPQTPSSRELYVRRLTVLMVIGLNRIGLSGRKARKFAAAELARTGLFDEPPTAKAIEHWRERLFPSLDPGAELLLATGIATAGRDHRKLALYFIGLCHLATNPTAVAVREPMLKAP